jgi:hypothetical protein
MTVAEIHASGYAKGGFVVFVEGLRYAWTNIKALAGTGASSWIGTSYGDREILLGLEMPPELPLGETDPWSGSIEQPQGVEFGLVDFDGTVAEIFKALEGDATTDSLGSRIAPTDDPAPETIVGEGAGLVDVWGRYAGIEAFGPEGERRYYWCCPGTAPPGLDHFSGVGWPLVRLTDSPTVWPGRKIAVYRIVQDPAGSWPNWQTQHDGGSLWWFGALKDVGRWSSGAQGQRRLSLAAAGPPAWLRKSAGLSRPSKWIPVQAGGLSLSGDELKVAVWIGTYYGQQIEDWITTVPSTYECQTLAGGNSLSGTTRNALAASLQTIIDYAIGDDASNQAWTGPVLVANPHWQSAEATRDAEISGDGGTIKIKCEKVSSAANGYYIGIAADVRVWQLWGWDITAKEFTSATQLFGQCPVGGSWWGENAGDEQLPPYHCVGRFDTRKAGDPDWKAENGGDWQVYEAPYKEGTITLDIEEAGDDIYIGIQDDVLCEGQLAQPYTYGAQIDGTDVDAAGWWVFRGKFLSAEAYEAGEDPIDIIQVAFCEWVANATRDGVAPDSNGYARIRTVRWEDPRIFGLPFAKLTEPWVNVPGNLECAPLGVLGGTALGGWGNSPSAPDWRHRMIPRILLSSGTAVFSEAGGSVSVTPGDNHPGDADADDPWPGDMEVADLGLCIPSDFVDWASWYAAASTITGGKNGALNRVCYPLMGSHRFEGDGGILQQAMRGAGLAWSLKRKSGGVVPAFGAYDPLRPLSLADVEVTLRRTDMAEMASALDDDGPKWRGEIDLRGGGPYDRFTFSADRNPLEDDYAYERAYESADEGRRYRDGRIEWEIEDGGLRNPSPWLGTPSQPLFDWTDQARLRFAHGFGPTHAKQRRIYRNTYNPRFAGLIGLGTVARVIDSTAVSPDGSIGVDHIGRVIEASIISRGSLRGCVRLSVELEAASDAFRVWGPLAIAGDNSWNAATSTLTISADHAGVGGDHDDTIGFTQPSWDTNTAGSLVVRIYQSENGVVWPSGMEVTAAVTAASAISHTLTLSSVTGDLYRDTYKVIVAAPRDEQTAAWALAIYSHVTEPDGTFDSEKGFRL